MARKTKKRSKQKGPSIGEILLAMVVLSIIAAAIGYASWIKFGGDVLDAAYCPVEGPKSITVVAIDASDPFDAVQVREIDTRVRRLLGEVSRGHRLDIYTMNASRGELAELAFSMCNPGRTTLQDRVAGQPTLVERRYRDEFSGAIDRAMKMTITSGSSNSSPILESIRAIAADAFGEAPNGRLNRLIVISDLVQHSEVYSMFRDGARDFELFSHTANYADAQTDLRGAEVDLIVILRSEYSHMQSRQLLLWWEQYFRTNNGTVNGFDRI